MKSISVHGIDTDMENAVRERAKKDGKSVNKVVKELIAEALGQGEKTPDNRAEFADLCGVWTEKETEEFAKAVADFNSVDEKDWQ